MEYQLQTNRMIEASARDVFAPVMYAFVSWVLKRAEQEKIKRLYFLARDGYQMYLTARILCAEQGYSVDCRYLKCSRFALRIPAFHLQGNCCLDLICQGGIDVTLKKVLKRTGMDESESIAMAENLGMAEEIDKVMSYQEIQKLKEQFVSSSKLMEWIFENSKKEYPKAAGYLRQEGLLENISYAIVDSGWIGTLQQTLQQILKKEGRDKPLRGFYFGLYQLPENVNPQLYDTFYFSPQGEIKRKVYFSNSLFECIFGAPEGMTLRYQEYNRKYTAVLEQKNNRNRVKIEQTADAVCRYVQELAKEQRVISSEDAERILFRFMGEPKLEEVEEFGNWKFTDDVLEEKQQIVAAKLSEEELSKNHFLNKSLIMLGLKKGPIHESAWIEGSAVRCGRHVRRHLRQIRRYKYVLYLRKEILEKRK